MYRAFFKRLLDVVLAALALVLLAPLLLVIAIAVRAAMGPPVLFRQTRPGRTGRPFRICKFRTMRVAREGETRVGLDEPSMTRLGRWLRATSLDELPELLNVLRGDMSLVGPRPLLMQYLPRYSPVQARRHEVRPGITGLAQVHGRNALTWERRFELDVDYVDRCTFALDLHIVLKTLVVALGRHGVAEPGRLSESEFLGSPPQHV